MCQLFWCILSKRGQRPSFEIWALSQLQFCASAQWQHQCWTSGGPVGSSWGQTTPSWEYIRGGDAFVTINITFVTLHQTGRKSHGDMGDWTFQIFFSVFLNVIASRQIFTQLRFNWYLVPNRLPPKAGLLNLPPSFILMILWASELEISSKSLHQSFPCCTRMHHWQRWE